MPIDFAKIKELFLATLEKPATERAAHLDAACADDPALRKRIEAMLQDHENSGELLTASPAELLGGNQATEAVGTAAFAPQANGSVTHHEQAVAAPDDLAFLAPSAQPGHLGRLGHYEVQEVIGKGGFGIVLKAFDSRLHRVVAIKVLSPAFAANGSARKRFIREARAAAAVKNEHVVGIHDVQEDANPPYLVMEFVDGVSLQDKVDKQGSLGVTEILRIGTQIAEGLAAAHKQGKIHRDIKPANILLENGVERVKITDFGLARAVDDASVTQSGTIAGTPMYMSPEQAEGLSIDHRSDLFSLGTVLYAMCTGRPPFRATGTMAVLKRVVEETPRPIREINHEIPEWLCAIIAKLHAKKPEERFQTAKEVAELLGQHLSDLQQGRAEPRKRPGDSPAAVGETPATPQQSSLAFRLVRFVLICAAVAGMGIGLFGVWVGVLSLLAFLFNFRGTASIGVGAGLLGIWALAVVWRFKLIRATRPWAGGIYPHAIGAGLAAASLLGLWLATPVILLVEADGADVELTLFNEQDGSTQRIGGGETTVAPGFYRVDPRCDASHRIGSVSITDGNHTREVSKDSFQVKLARGDRVTLNIRVLPLEAKEPGWVQLFNGKDLTGWTSELGGNANWQIVDGAMTCSGAIDHLYTKRDDFGDFHLRAEVKINDDGNSGIYFRTGKPHMLIGDYEAQITNAPGQGWKTGALYGLSPIKTAAVGPNIWFTYEIIAVGNQIRLLVNGKETASFQEIRPNRRSKGHIALQHYDPKTIVHFRKIEIKELPPAGSGWVQLFNGKDLTGWKTHPNQPGDWKVESGVLIGSGRKSHLFSERGDYDNFHVRVEAKINNLGDSSLFFRAPFVIFAAEGARGYDAQIMDNRVPGFKTGSLLGLGARDIHIVESLIRVDEWFTLEVIAKENRIIIKVNGTTTVDYLDDFFTFKKGYFALQVGNTETVACFRKIEIKELPPNEPGWVQLFNGKDLTGWKTHPDQPGKWEVKDGILIGSGLRSHLFSERGDYENFHLRVEAKINDLGNSGVYFRSEYGLGWGGKNPKGYEAQIFQGDAGDPYKTGSIYSLVKVTDDLTKPNAWFTMDIIVTGNHTVTKVNGQIAVDYVDPAARYKRGHFALQVERPFGTVVQFRKIEVKELPRGAPPPSPPPPLAVVPFEAAKAMEHQQAWAKHVGAPVEVENSLGMKLRLIPPGEFDMKPELHVTITKPFRMGIHEVTIKQFRAFVEEIGYKTDAEKFGMGVKQNVGGEKERDPEFTWRHKDVDQGPDYPVGQMSWNDAVKFCQWLSAKEKRTYRLPTEAEWEWVCRAGTMTAFHFGDDAAALDEYAWHAGNSDNRSHPVGLKKPNAWGLHDMHGNVTEFCQDWFGPLEPGRVTDPRGPATGKGRVIRSTAFFSKAGPVGTSRRGSMSQPYSMNQFGFRVVCEEPAMLE